MKGSKGEKNVFFFVWEFWVFFFLLVKAMLALISFIT